MCRKEGATEVRNHGEAEQVLQAAAAAAQAIHGLGPGGNVPIASGGTQGTFSNWILANVHRPGILFSSTSDMMIWSMVA